MAGKAINKSVSIKFADPAFLPVKNPETFVSNRVHEVSMLMTK